MTGSRGSATRFIDWGSIVEDELRPMIAEYWRRAGYTVTNVHAKQELGADLICERPHRSKPKSHRPRSTVLIKRSPVQGDLGQIATARRNYGGPIDYYYTGRASGPFIAACQRMKGFILHDETETEKLMVESDNTLVFYYAFSFHPAVISFARTITEIARRCERTKTPTKSSLRISEADLLNFYDGAAEVREIIDMTQNDVVRFANKIKNTASNDKGLIRIECADLLRTRLERLQLVCEYKLKSARAFPRKLAKALHGYHAWGNTYANWLSSIGKTYDEHLKDVERHLLHGYGYEMGDDEFGINEAARCLQSMNLLATYFKKNARSLVVGAVRNAFSLKRVDDYETTTALRAIRNKSRTDD